MDSQAFVFKPASTEFKFSFNNVRDYIYSLWEATKYSPEKVAYADFAVKGTPCGIEVIMSSDSETVCYINLKKSIITASKDDLLSIFQGLLDRDHLDSLGNIEWTLRFDNPQLVPRAVWVALRTFCFPSEGDIVTSERWWS